jgi:hypothetical protein
MDAQPPATGPLKRIFVISVLLLVIFVPGAVALAMLLTGEAG